MPTPIALTAAAIGDSAVDGDFQVLGQLLIGADTNLYRAGGDILRTDDRFDVYRPLGTDIAFLTAAANLGSFGAWFVMADGKLNWGPGNAAVDVNLYRRSNDQLGTDDEIFVTRASASDQTLGMLVSGDSVRRLEIRADGSLRWGPGNSAADITLTRIALAGTAVGLALSVGGIRLGSYTTATKPSASSMGAGSIIYVSDGGSGAVFQGSNGSAWVNLG